ncbi:MAG TPA: hypothetical protein VKR22_10535 [Acidimicrobiales bacterium]|nr:hypothetical protein [Acidimicrobiales bacterium]
MTTFDRKFRLAAGGAALTVGLMAAAALAGPSLASAATTTTLASAGGSAGTGGTTNVSAPWCTASTFPEVQKVVEGDLSDRVSRLGLLVSRVNAASSLSSSDKAALLADLTQTEQPGIEALVAKVPTDTTCAEVRQDAHSMVWNYRVYLVMSPQVDLVIATDAALAIDARLDAVEGAISNLIADAQQHGHDVSGAQQALSDYEQQVSAVQSVLAGQSATVLGVTPAGYPGNAPTLHQARSNLQTARSDFRKARSDLATIRSDLS